MTLTEIIEAQRAVLNDGASSSQLSAPHVTQFAALVVGALGMVAEQLAAIKADAVADMVADLGAHQLIAQELAADLAAQRKTLDALKAEAADAAGMVESLRSTLAELQAQANAGAPA